MKTTVTALVLMFVSATAFGQIPQIPTVQPCNLGKAAGSAQVYLSKRQDVNSAGTIDITIADVVCDPTNGDGHPTGSISMRFSLSDSSIADMQVTLIEQTTTLGKATPTTYLSGRCTANGGTIPCHFWLTLTDNRVPSLPGTPDVVGVLVIDKKGNTLTYGTGPVKTGDISVWQF